MKFNDYSVKHSEYYSK